MGAKLHEPTTNAGQSGKNVEATRDEIYREAQLASICQASYP